MSRLDELINELCPYGVEFRPLKIVCELSKGVQLNRLDTHESGSYPVINGGINPTGYIEQYNQEADTITISQGGASAGYVQWINSKFWAGAHCYVLRPRDGIDNRFLYHFMKSKEYELQKAKYGAGIPALAKATMEELLIPMPPSEVQAEIAGILGKFTELIDLLERELTLRRKQYEYYCEHLLTFGDNVKRITLGQVGKICMCRRIMRKETSTTGDVPFYKIGTFGGQPDAYISRELFEQYKNAYPYPRKGEVLISAAGTIGKTVIFDGNDAYFQDSNIVWIANDESQVLNGFLYYFYQLQPWRITKGGTIKRLYNDSIMETVIPVPPLDEQRRIASMLDKFTGLISLVEQELAARRKQYAYYRDKLLTFTAKVL